MQEIDEQFAQKKVRKITNMSDNERENTEPNDDRDVTNEKDNENNKVMNKKIKNQLFEKNMEIFKSQI